MIIKRECRAVSRMLWDYTLHQLAEWDVDRVEIHVSRCARCQRDLQTYRVTSGLVRASRKEVEPESKTTWHALRAQIEHARQEECLPAAPPQKRGSVLPAWTGAIAAGALLAAVWALSRPADSDVPDTLLPQANRPNNPVVSEGPAVEIQPIIGSSEGLQPGPDIAPARAAVEPAAFRPDARRSPTRMAESAARASITTKRKEKSERRANSEQNQVVKPAPLKAAPDKPDAGSTQELEPVMPQREFVMGVIPTAGPRIVPVSTGSLSDEAPVW